MGNTISASSPTFIRVIDEYGLCTSLKARERQPNHLLAVVLKESFGTMNPPFSSQCDDRPIVPILIRLLLHLRAETNRTHNPISKLLVQHRLISIPIVLHNLVQSVNQRLLWRHLDTAATVWKPTQLNLERAMVDVEDRGKFLDVFWASSGLAVENGGDGDLFAADFFGECFEGELLLGFCCEEGGGGFGEIGMLSILKGTLLSYDVFPMRIH